MGKRGKRSLGGAGGRRVPRAKNVFGEAARKLPLAQPPSLHRAGQDHNHRRGGGEVDLQEDRPCGGLQVHYHAGEVPEAVALRGQTHPWPHQGGGLHHLRVGRGVHPVSPQEPAHGGPQHTVPLQGRKRPGLLSRNDGGSKILLFFYIEKCIQNLISTSYQGLNF